MSMLTKIMGLDAPPEPAAGAIAQVDPKKQAALDQWGDMARARAGATDQPGAFNSGASTYRPVIASGGARPQATQYQGVGNYTRPNRNFPGTGPTAQELASYSQQQQAPAMSSRQQTPAMSTRQQAPAMSTRQQAPAMQSVSTASGVQTGEGGYGLNLGRPGSVNADTTAYQSAITSAMQQAQQPQNLQAGFDPAMRETAIRLATSGLEKQRQDAMARLKEEQMKSGNYGSSVGQKALADLSMEFDRRISDAGSTIDLQNMQAQREDRYKNLDQNSARLNQIAGLAGSGQGMALSSADFTRQGINQNANLQTTEAQFGREGRGIDTATNKYNQEFNRSGQQINNDTAMQLANYGSSEDQRNYANQMSNANFGASEDQRSFSNQMANANYGSAEDQRMFSNQMANANYGSTENQRMFANQLAAQDFARTGSQQDFQNREVANNSDWANLMQAQQFNRESQSMSSADALAKYMEEQRQRENAATIMNQGSQWRSDQARQDYNTNYSRYRDTVGDLAAYAGGDPYTAGSKAMADAYANQGKNPNDGSAFWNTAFKLIK